MNTFKRIACRSLTRPFASIGTLAWGMRHALALVAFALALNLDVGSGQPARPLRDLLLPPDAQAICPFATGELSDWFKAGAVETNGVVRPPNSMTFTVTSPHCDFFKWAARTFLWLTSTGDGGGMTFESPEFFAVAAPDEQRRRYLLRGTVAGTDARGAVNYAASTGGKPVEHSGQPGSGGVLMAQNRSLVYVANHVNEIFAYFMTGVKKGELVSPGSDIRIPVTDTDLRKLVAYAKSKGVVFANPNTLTVVVKSAWIETDGLDASKYITIKATVPKFNTSNPKQWTRDDVRQTTLALVGMHVAAGLRGDASMIWATFEHIANNPVSGFAYLGQNGETLSAAAIDANPEGGWNFSNSGCAAGTNKARIFNRGGVIKTDDDGPIGPINTCRINAWGAPEPPLSPLENNTRIIDVNRHSFGQLPPDDVRSNYLLVGANWNLGQGSRTLANTTLETFTQEKGCLDCHSGNLTTPEDASGGGTGMKRLNQMWPRLQPLP
jgi:hypothetical protein